MEGIVKWRGLKSQGPLMCHCCNVSVTLVTLTVTLSVGMNEIVIIQILLLFWRYMYEVSEKVIQFYVLVTSTVSVIL